MTLYPISNTQNITKNSPPEIWEGYYTISIGYRKIGGNFCKRGVNFDPIKISCLYNKFLYAISFLYFNYFWSFWRNLLSFC